MAATMTAPVRGKAPKGKSRLTKAQQAKQAAIYEKTSAEDYEGPSYRQLCAEAKVPTGRALKALPFKYDKVA